MNKNTLLKYMAAAILLGASSTAPAAVSYFNDFSGASDGKWSNYTTYTTTEATPNQVLGRFAGTGAGTGTTLSLSGLDGHYAVAVEFDLYLFDTWDSRLTNTGSSNPKWNPDLIQVSSDNQLQLSLGFEATNKSVLTEYVSGTTTLQIAAGDFGGLDARDRVFHISALFAHSAPTLNLMFATLSMQGINDESYGIDNIRVSTVVPIPSSALLIAGGMLVISRKRRAMQLKR